MLGKYKRVMVYLWSSKSKLCLVATAEGIPLLDAVKSSTKESNGLLIAGPENNNLTVNTGNGADFRRKEVELMLQAGYITVGLGPHRLQAETEIIALLATLVMWSDSQETTA
ncbi:hypothetical protein YC2023_060149 [Brassica napus]